jgi:PAS domain S-box-containing protein
MAAILSIISFYWYFVEPVRTIYIYSSEIPYFIIFVAFAALISWFATIRRRAEKALREKADLLDLTHDTVFVMDLEGVIKYWNRGAEECYGWTAEQAVGRVVHELLETVFPVPLEQIKAEVTRTGRWEGELVHTKKDGTQVVVASRWSLQRAKQGTPVAILETNNDITERKRAGEALHESERKYRELVEHANSIILRWTHDGRITFLNEFGLKFFGYSAEEIIGRDVVGTIVPPTEKAGRDLRQLMLQIRGDPEVFEQTINENMRGNGERATVAWTNKIVWGAEGGVSEILSIGTDITERKHAEEALRRSESYLAESQALTHTCSWAADGTTRMTLYWSEETFRMWGFDPEQGLPTWRQIVQRIHPQDFEKYKETVEKVFVEKLDVDFEYRIVLPDGTVKHVHTLAHPVLNPAGEVREVKGTTVDITERKRAEQERERLRQLETHLGHINRVSMMGELATSVAHEVNQPITGVVSNGSACLRWLAGDVPNVEEAREAARRIVRDGKRAGEVIARIRALTRRATTPWEKLDLNDTIREVLALVGDEARRKSVSIRTQFADDLSRVSGDRVELQQVVLNLVMNAIEAMSDVTNRGRDLVLTTRNLDADQVQVTIEDSGPGIDPTVLDKIFDPFYTTKSGGMGMGLSISRSILQAHGGRLWATRKDGLGTIFHFTFPKYHEEDSHAGVAGA